VNPAGIKSPARRCFGLVVTGFIPWDVECGLLRSTTVRISGLIRAVIVNDYAIG